jgi:Zn-dependent protease
MRFDLEIILIMTPILLIALPFHEYAHAFVAWKLGDPTAKDAGRLALNPFKHLDILGVLMMYVAHIGWAKPVPVNSVYFKNRRKGMLLVALAGPLSNVLLAFVFILLMGFVVKLIAMGVIKPGSETMVTVLSYVVAFFQIFSRVNISLAVFNLLPVPPLDGSRLISAFVPEESYFRFARYEQYIGIAFLVLVIALPNVLSKVIGFFVDPVFNSMLSFTTMIFGL